MKLKCNPAIGRDGPAKLSGKPAGAADFARAAAFLALFGGGCSFESPGLPGIDGRVRDASREMQSGADFRKDAVKDARTYDAAGAADTLRVDNPVSKPDSMKPDSYKPDSAKSDGSSKCPSASTGSFTGTVSSGTPQFVGGYRFDFKGVMGTSAILDVSCGGTPIKTGLKCAVGSKTVFTVQPDSKRISVSPASAGIYSMSGTISVDNL